MLDANGVSTAFGLTIRDHDSRTMQHILRAYGTLPENPNIRHSLYLALTTLETWLNENEALLIRDWVQARGSLSNFPGPSVAQGPPVNSSDLPITYARIVDSDDDTTDDEELQPAETVEAVAEEEDDDDIEGSQDDDEDIEETEDDDDDEMTDAESESASDLSDGANDPDNNLDFDIVAHEHHMDQLKANRTLRATLEENTRRFSRAVNASDQNRAERTDGDEEEDSDEGGYEGSSYAALIGLRQRLDEMPEGLKECCICIEQSPEGDFPAGRVTSTCKHNRRDKDQCRDCIYATIYQGIENGQVGGIRCAVCSEIFTHKDILKHGTPDLITRYNHLLLSSNPEYIMCLGPYCGSGQMHPENLHENPVMTCDSCGFLTCVVHKLPWHQGLSCEEFDSDESQIERLEADEATAKLLSQTSRVCPACKQGVTKTEGCDHLQCRCGESWCWECLASWENIIRIGNVAHARHCRYHPDKVRLRRDQIDTDANNMVELVHGGPVSESLAKARDLHNTKLREKLRPLALEAAEKRAKEEAELKKQSAKDGGGMGGGLPAKKKVKLVQPWEEK